MQQRIVVANLASSIEQLGLNYDQLRPEIDKAIESLRAISNVSEKDAKAAFDRLLITTENYDAALRALPAAAALAAGTGKTIQEAADIIGKAMSGDKGAIKQLRDLGVAVRDNSGWTDVLTQAQKRYAAALEASNDPAAKAIANIKDMVKTLQDSFTPIVTPALQGVAAALKVLLTSDVEIGAFIKKGLGPLKDAFVAAFGTMEAAVRSLIELYNKIPLLPNIPLPRPPHPPGVEFGEFPPDILGPGGIRIPTTPAPTPGVPVPIPVPPITPIPFNRAAFAAAGFSAAELSHIKFAQRGGIVTRPTALIAGEAGPEAIIPLGKGRGSSMVTINFNGSVYGLADFQARVLEAVRNAQTRGGFAFVIG
jgi:hypothetical protein